MNTFLNKAIIPFSVFITGACVLIIELIAIRILAPYFGNTIFTVSSVISIVLAALSLGYYIGGRLADKNPSERFFYSIIATSGLLVIILHLLGIVFLSNFGYKLSIIKGPLISSTILFFVQSFLLGLLSPFAVKLQKIRVNDLGIGSASGQIFFWSTLGSIFGSLLSGFYLIPNFGIDKIMLGVGFLLIIMGLIGALKNGFKFKIFLLFFLSILSIFFINLFNLSNSAVVFAKDSLYQKITIHDGIYKGRPTRFLLQDRNSSAAMFISSDELVYEYTKYYTLYQIFNQNIKDALMIGGGAYSVPKDLLKNSPGTNIDVAEIDPELFKLVKEYFNVPNNERLNNFSEDGRRFLYDTNKKYDFIFSDAYSSFFSTPEHLTTIEFFELAKSKLSDNGVFIANVVGSLSKRPQSFVLSEIKTFKSVFNNSYFFAVNSPNITGPQNMIFLGYKGDKIANFNSKEIKNNKNFIISNLSEHQINIDNFNLSEYPKLTDNYAPVDYLMSKEFTNLK